MLVRILDSAHNDIRDGYWFYENQEPGVGDYFSDTLYGEIESLSRVFTTSVLDSIAHSPAGFPILSIMTSRTEKRASMAYWTTAAIRIGHITISKSRKSRTDSSYDTALPPELQGYSA